MDRHHFVDKTLCPLEINVLWQGYEVETLSKEILENYVLKWKGKVDEDGFVALEALGNPSQEST